MWTALVERWQRWEAARAGRKDGRRGIPAADDPHAPFALRAIVARGEDALWRVARAWAEEERALGARAEQLRGELAEAGARRDELRERLAEARRGREADEARDDAELERLAGLRRELDERVVGAHPAAGPTPGAGSEPRPALPAISGAGAEPPAPASPAPARTPAPAEASADGTARPGVSAWAYRLALALIVAGEFPLNAVAFRLFGEPDLTTGVMVIGLAVVLVGMAHGAGVLLAREDPTPRERGLLWLTAGLPVAAIVAVALIRAVYLEEVVGRRGLGRWFDAAAFAAINATIFGGAVLLSYLRHDPASRENLRAARRRREREAARAERRERRRRERLLEEDRQRRERERQERERFLEEERSRLDREIRGIEERKRARRAAMEALEGRLEELEGRIRVLEQALGALEEDRARRWRARRALALRRRAHFQALVHAYCAANVRTREDRRTPPALAEPPALPLPEAFAADAPPGR